MAVNSDQLSGISYQSAQMVGALLGSDDFAVLLSCLPDEFFDHIGTAIEDMAWRLIWKAVNRGERDPQKLAEVVNVLASSTE